VASALGTIGDSRAIEPLVATLKDHDENVRLAAESLEKVEWKPKNNIQHALYLAARQDWVEALRIGVGIVEFAEVYPQKVIQYIFGSDLPKSVKLEKILKQFGLPSGREDLILCECGLPVQHRFSDNTNGVMYQFCSMEVEEMYTNIYSCANCGRYVTSITS